MALSKVLIFGSTGMLGSSLCPYLLAKGHQVLTAGRVESSTILFEGSKVSPSFYENVARLQPEVIINLIAATNVDQCERLPELAYELNSEVVKAIAGVNLVCKTYTPHIIHISTDQVYAGLGPHKEARPRPCNVYGASKLAGEKWVLEVGGTVLRTNFVGASRNVGRDGFTDWLIKSNLSKLPINVLEDVLFSPGHINDVCEAIDLVLKYPRGGIYNFGSQTAISKSEFSFAFIEGLNLASDLLKKSRLDDLSLLAQRPNDMSMDVSLFEKNFTYKCPTIFDVIKKCIKDYQYE